jgi:ABC-type uncharacterized transport system permease subunit
MTNSALNFLAVVFYLVAAAVLLRRLARGEAPTRLHRALTLGAGVAAVALHGIVLYAGPQPAGGINLSVTGAFALVAWLVACLYLLVSLWRPIDNLGVVVMPVAALTVLIEWLRPIQVPVVLTSPLQALHIVVALVAYSLLCLAAVQSLMLLIQDRKLKHKHPGGFLRALPPMQTMEEIMFQMIALGFVLLTATLASGVVFSERVFGTPLKLTHHIVFAALGWVVYTVLLVGRWRFGWRGRTAVRWTLGGFALLVLGFLGTKFVLEVILHR